MINHFIIVAIPVALIVFFSIASTIFMGMRLSLSEFGDFALLKTFILIGSTFSIIGIDNYMPVCRKCYLDMTNDN